MSDLVEIGGLRGDRAKCYRHGAEITEGDHVLVIVAFDRADCVWVGQVTCLVAVGEGFAQVAREK